VTGPRIAHVATIDLTLKALLLPQLRAIRDAGFEVSTISAPGPWVAQIQNEGIRHIPWRNATRAWDLRSDLKALFELIGILRRERFDLVHTHNAKPGVMGRVAARSLRVPCIVNTVHGFDARSDDPLPRRIGFLGAEWLSAQLSDLELYQGRGDLALARRLRMVRNGKGVFLGNGADLSRFDPDSISPGSAQDLRREFGFPPEAVVVGTIGRLVGEKGYRELFTAAAEVRRELPNVRFLAIGGPDPAKADAINEGEVRAAGQLVTFAGWREDIRELLAMMDVFVLASWREGVPRSAIEAAAMGKPLILTDIPGCRQIAREGVEALFIQPKDAGGLAAAVKSLVSDPDLRAAMGAAARRRAVEQLDERHVVGTILEQYELLFGRKRVKR
jgi:glycosyltransferase involved in cell wall biosynthesis